MKRKKHKFCDSDITAVSVHEEGIVFMYTDGTSCIMLTAEDIKALAGALGLKVVGTTNE